MLQQNMGLAQQALQNRLWMAQCRVGVSFNYWEGAQLSRPFQRHRLEHMQFRPESQSSLRWCRHRGHNGNDGGGQLQGWSADGPE